MCLVKLVFSHLWISSSHGLVPQIESWQEKVSSGLQKWKEKKFNSTVLLTSCYIISKKVESEN